MEDGLQVDRLILCKAEVISIIHHNLEEDLKLLDLHYIGDLIGVQIISKKHMDNINYQVALSLIVSILLVYIGTIKSSTLISITTLIEF